MRDIAVLSAHVVELLGLKAGQFTAGGNHDGRARISAQRAERCLAKTAISGDHNRPWISFSIAWLT
jgi:hypothetical protein